MKKKDIYYMLVLIGFFVVFYLQIGSSKNRYLLVIGITLFMFGLYNISSHLISNKKETNFVEKENEEEE